MSYRVLGAAAAGKVIQIVRGHAKTTNEMEVSVSVSADVSSSTFAAVGYPDDQLNATNGTTAVTICSNPGLANTTRIVQRISIANNDTVADTVTLSYGTAGAGTNFTAAMNIPSGYTLNYEDALGWYLTDSTGAVVPGSPTGIGGIVTVAYQVASGTTGGTATTGAWTKYAINTIIQNDLNIAAISSNQFILPAGTYLCIGGGVTFSRTGTSQARLRNVTDGSTLVLSVDANTQNAVNEIANFAEFLIQKFTIGANKTLEIDYWANATAGTHDLGFSASTGGNSQYGYISLQKIA